MSNLTVGKIVNNSATLVLNSTDQDGFGKKVVTGSNFTKKDGVITPAGTYQVIADNFYAKQPYLETFFQLDEMSSLSLCQICQPNPAVPD